MKAKEFFWSVIIVLMLSSSAWADELDQLYSRYRLIRSNWHCHTSDSRNAWSEMKKPVDADHLPAESAQKTLQRAQEMDLVLILTDHNIKLYPWQWKAQGDLIMLSSLEDQLSLRGFEWTPWDYNHVNIINSRDYVTADNRQIEGVKNCPTIGELLDWLDGQPDDVIAQLNHPLYYNKLFDFSAIANHPASRFFNAIEIGSGPPIHYQWAEEECQRAWQCGLKVGVTLGIDNFGRITKNARHKHTAAWLEGQKSDRQSLIAAMQSRRFFASEDEDIEVLYALNVDKADGRIELYPMGSEVFADQEDCLTLMAKVNDPTDKDWTCELMRVEKDYTAITARVDSQTNNNVLNYNVGKFVSICYYLNITQKDGERVVTSPIWIRLLVDSELESIPQPDYYQKMFIEAEKDTQRSDPGQEFTSAECYFFFHPIYLYPKGPIITQYHKSIHSRIYVFLKLYNFRSQDQCNYRLSFIPENNYPDMTEINQQFSIHGPVSNNNYRYFWLEAETINLPTGKYSIEFEVIFAGQKVEKKTVEFYLYD